MWSPVIAPVFEPVRHPEPNSAHGTLGAELWGSHHEHLPEAAPPHLGQDNLSGGHRLPESHLAKEEAFGAEQRRGAMAGRAHGAALG